MNVEELYTIDELAAKQKLRPDTIRHWLSKGRLKKTKIGRLTRISKSDFEAFVAESTKADAEKCVS